MPDLYFGELREFGVPFTGRTRQVDHPAGGSVFGWSDGWTETQLEYQVPDDQYGPGYLGWVPERFARTVPW